MKVVSACLAGRNCRYDGKSKPNQVIMELVEQGKALPVCPEELGGLGTPRIEAEQQGDRVVTKEGRDVTEGFKKGANLAYELASQVGSKEAILKARSPSCGCGKVYDGTFTGKLKEGDGVFAKLLKSKGFKILTEEDLQ